MENTLTPETMQLNEVAPPGFTAPGKSLINEVEKLKEAAEEERKRVAKLMEHSYIVKAEWRKRDAEEKYEELDKFLFSTVICSRGRPVKT